MPKFPVQSSSDKKLRILWLRFLREINANTTSISPELLAVPEIEQAIHLAEEAAYSAAELNAYEAYWSAVSTEKTLLVGRYEEGKAEGIEEGIMEGENRALHKMAKKLLAEGMDVQTVVRLTGLSPAEIGPH